MSELEKRLDEYLQAYERQKKPYRDLDVEPSVIVPGLPEDEARKRTVDMLSSLFRKELSAVVERVEKVNKDKMERNDRSYNHYLAVKQELAAIREECNLPLDKE